jgi:hypothetical protein
VFGNNATSEIINRNFLSDKSWLAVIEVLNETQQKCAQFFAKNLEWIFQFETIWKKYLNFN